MDPIRGTGYSEYPKINSSPSRMTGNGEKFSLDYEETKKEDEKADELKEKGVTLELSGQAPGRQQAFSAQFTEENDAASKVQDGASLSLRSFFGNILERITSVWQSFVQAVSDFWNDGAEEKEVAEEVAEEAAEKAAEEVAKEAAEEEVKYLRRTESDPMNMTALPKLEGKLAKNSDLLTYYDQTGRFVNIPDSDKNRILRGDKDQISL